MVSVFFASLVVHGGDVLVLLGVVTFLLFLLLMEDVVGDWIVVQFLLHVVLSVGQHVFIVLTLADGHPEPHNGSQDGHNDEVEGLDEDKAAHFGGLVLEAGDAGPCNCDEGRDD